MDRHISGKCVSSAVPRIVQKDSWEHTTLPQSRHTHSTQCLGNSPGVGSRCGHRLKGKHTVKQVAFSMFIKRVVGLLVKIVLVM